MVSWILMSYVICLSVLTVSIAPGDVFPFLKGQIGGHVTWASPQLESWLQQEIPGCRCAFRTTMSGGSSNTSSIPRSVRPAQSSKVDMFIPRSSFIVMKKLLRLRCKPSRSIKPQGPEKTPWNLPAKLVVLSRRLAKAWLGLALHAPRQEAFLRLGPKTSRYMVTSQCCLTKKIIHTPSNTHVG